MANGQAVDYPTTLEGNQIVNLYSIPQDYTSFAAPSGGLAGTTTTSQRLFAAGAAGIRNYLASVQICVSGTTTATVEVLILDGSTVIFRIPWVTGATGCQSPPTRIPLKGSAATAMNYQLSASAGGGAFYVDAQGYVSQ